jgi:hypothetical protein
MGIGIWEVAKSHAGGRALATPPPVPARAPLAPAPDLARQTLRPNISMLLRTAPWQRQPHHPRVPQPIASPNLSREKRKKELAAQASSRRLVGLAALHMSQLPLLHGGGIFRPCSPCIPARATPSPCDCRNSSHSRRHGRVLEVSGASHPACERFHRSCPCGHVRSVFVRGVFLGGLGEGGGF